jgi:hypothetical protein
MVNIGDICPVCNRGKLLPSRDDGKSLHCYNCGYWVSIEKEPKGASVGMGGTG